LRLPVHTQCTLFFICVKTRAYASVCACSHTRMINKKRISHVRPRLYVLRIQGTKKRRQNWRRTKLNKQKKETNWDQKKGGRRQNWAQWGICVCVRAHTRTRERVNLLLRVLAKWGVEAHTRVETYRGTHQSWDVQRHTPELRRTEVDA
jgi:hypothetical protein